MNHVPSKIRDVIAQLRQRLKDLYGERFRDLLLFGSYARGEADEGSDVDLLLLLVGPVDPVREIVHLEPVKWPLALEADLLLAVVPVSEEDFQRGETSFLRTVRREAIPISWAPSLPPGDESPGYKGSAP